MEAVLIVLQRVLAYLVKVVIIRFIKNNWVSIFMILVLISGFFVMEYNHMVRQTKFLFYVKPPMGTQSGEWIWPTQGTTLSSNFGWRVDPFTGVQDFHTGLDIPAQRYTPVVATADGKLINMYPVSGYGECIMIEHSDGLVSLYGHLSAYTDHMKLGDEIKKGQVIGFVGSTGRSTGAHLHFEVRKNGNAIDPKPLVNASLLAYKKNQEKIKTHISTIAPKNLYTNKLSLRVNADEFKTTKGIPNITVYFPFKFINNEVQTKVYLYQQQQIVYDDQGYYHIELAALVSDT